MALSFVRKIQKILEKPVPPPHIQQRNYMVVVPWHQRLWNSIRPPSAVPGQARMSGVQRRLVLAVTAALGLLVAGWFAFDYVSSAPLRAREAYEAGMQKLGPGDYQGAVDDFTRSIGIAETPQAYLERGNARASLGQGAAAIEDWSRALALDPALAEAYTARATHYRIAGDLERARQDLDRSIEIQPSVDAYYQRGQVHHLLNEYAEALADYDRAIELRREAPYVYLARSATRRAMGDEAGYQEDQRTASILQRN